MERKPIIFKGEIIEMSFDEVYKQFERLAYSIVYNMCKPDDEQEDLIQTARIAMWRSYQTYDASKGFAFTTYAGNLITKKILFSWRCKKNRIKTVSLDRELRNSQNNETFILQDITPAVMPDIDAGIDVRRTLSRMNERRRNILLMHRYGYDQLTIGKSFGVSQPQVSRLRKKAENEFKRIYSC